jgi:hypothetical protein
MTWVLILYMAGSSGTPALATVAGFSSKSECEVAGKASESALDDMFTSFRFTCVEKSK